ncbi:MAG: hypothetical protein ACQETQ_00230 [Spirochaetota bacterium]
MKKACALVLLSLALSWYSFGQNQVRGRLTTELTVEPSNTDGVEAPLRAERLAAISIDQELAFLKGIQLEIRVPDVVRESGGGFALYLYGDVSPAPSSGRRQYEGRQISSENIPNTSRFFMSVPVSGEHRLKQTADTHVVDSVVPPDQFPLLMTILPVMKGMPDDAMSAEFSITAKPLLLDVGAAQFRILDPEGTDILESAGSLREFQLFLDGEQRDYDGEPFFLAPGLHRVSLESARFENQRRTFGVERGAVSEVQLQLEEPQSSVSFEAPQDVTLFVDGEEVDHTSSGFTLSPGDHTVTFQIGEYTVSRRIEVEPKKSYEISLSLDILISED